MPLRGLRCCELKPWGWRTSVGLGEVGTVAPESGLGSMDQEAGVDLLTPLVLCPCGAVGRGFWDHLASELDWLMENGNRCRGQGELP